MNAMQSLFQAGEMGCTWKRISKEVQSNTNQPIVYIAWKKGLKGYGVAFLMTDNDGKYLTQYCDTMETDDKTMVKLYVVREALRQATKANVRVEICMEEEDKKIVSFLQSGGSCKLRLIVQQWKYQCLVDEIEELKHVALVGITRIERNQESLLEEVKRWVVTSSNIKFSYAFFS